MKISDEIEARCKAHGVVLDTNMLIIYLIGLADHEKIGKTQRTKEYTEKDFQCLYHLVDISKNKKLYITPQSIPETLFLLGMDPGKNKDDGPIKTIKKLKAILMEELKKSEELYVKTPDIVANHKDWEFCTYGIADLSFEHSLQSNSLVFISSDERYVDYLVNKGIFATSLKRIKESVGLKAL